MKSRGCQTKPSSQQVTLIYRSWTEAAAGDRGQGTGEGVLTVEGAGTVEVKRPGGLCMLESQGSNRKQ